MNGISPRAQGYIYYGLNVEIRLERIVISPYLIALICLVAVQRIPVFIGEYGYC